MAKPSIPKGTRDFLPEEMRKRNYIFNTIKEVYALYGFQQIETPVSTSRNWSSDRKKLQFTQWDTTVQVEESKT